MMFFAFISALFFAYKLNGNSFNIKLTNMKTEKERTLFQLLTYGCLFAFIYTGYKYVSLRSAYHEAESVKVYYCKEYHKLKCQAKSDSLIIDDLYQENQTFTSMLGSIENEEGGHELLKKLWDAENN
jgi:hypothetical protein